MQEKDNSPANIYSYLRVGMKCIYIEPQSNVLGAVLTLLTAPAMWRVYYPHLGAVVKDWACEVDSEAYALEKGSMPVIARCRYLIPFPDDDQKKSFQEEQKLLDKQDKQSNTTAPKQKRSVR